MYDSRTMPVVRLKPRLGKKLSTLACSLFLTISTPQFAHADLITQLHGFSGATLDMIGVTPFTPSLGTLDSVNVSISGNLQVTGVLARQSTATPGGEILNPYSYRILTTQNFFGLAGKYFEFSQPATLNSPVLQTAGEGSFFTYTTTFNYSFSFNEFTDMLGFALPTTSASPTTSLIPPPAGIIGTRARFLETAFPLDEIDFSQSVQAVSFGGPPPLISTFNAGGSLAITYDYTPPVIVSEPSVALLLLVGLLCSFGNTRLSYTWLRTVCRHGILH